MTATIWVFALGQLGWSILAGLVSNWLVYFYQPSTQAIDAGQLLYVPQGRVVLGVLTIIGVITAVGRIFDAFTDPWIANRSDRSTNPKGRRIPFMRWVAVPFALVTTLIFMAPVKSISGINTAWLLFSLLGFYLCMTIYCTPFNALIPMIGNDQKSRIAVSTAISLTFIVGTAFAYLAPIIWGALTPTLGRITSMRVTFGGLSLFACICMLIPTFVIDETKLGQVEPSKENAFDSLKITFKNKDFRTFVYSDVLYFTALTIFQTGLPFFVTSLMGLEESATSLLFVMMTALSLVWYPFINKLTPKYGKKRLVRTAFILFTITYILTALSGIFVQGKISWGIMIVALSSIPMAILGILPQAMVADVAEEDTVLSGTNRDGMFFAARTFAFKMGQSLAMLIFTAFAASGQMGYRMAAISAALLCVLANIALIRYDEKRILSVCLEHEQSLLKN